MGRLLLFIVAAATVSACGGSSVEEPVGPPGEGLVRRHFDQVCQAEFTVNAVVGVDELFDTVGLGSELEGEGLRPETRLGVEREVHFMTHYGTDGSPGAAGVWESTEPSAATAGIEGILRRRIRRLPGLLEPKGFHTLLTLTPWPVLAPAGAVQCLPHMVHHGGEPPVGLPEDVRVQVGRPFVRDGDMSSVVVRLSFDATGQITEVEHTAGHPDTFSAVAAFLPDLVFQPALRNGIPVPTQLNLGFRFRR